MDARNWLLSRGDLEVRGFSAAGVSRALTEGALRRIDHGWYVPGDMWVAEFTEGRHLLRVVAAQARRRGSDDVVSHESAAVLHGLPLFRCEPERVHVSGVAANGRVRASAPMIARHELTVAQSDRVEVEGIACTSLARTVADVIRASSAETAIALLDAAFRRTAWSDSTHEYDEDAAAELREEIARRLPRGGRGVKQGRLLLDLADGRAQLPGESVSRLYLLELGFARPRLQVPIDGPERRTYYVDFGLDDVDAWGEFDGKGKYTDPRLRQVSDIEEAVLAEKMREDWIRGRTNRRFARWGFAHIGSASSLGRRLAAFGIHPL